jgi:hypothetical protein
MGFAHEKSCMVLHVSRSYCSLAEPRHTGRKSQPLLAMYIRNSLNPIRAVSDPSTDLYVSLLALQASAP